MSKSYQNFLAEAKTKSGDEITFKYIDDVEGDENRGWQVDRIDAYVNGHHAGYIKASYIPKKRFEAKYHNILNYLSMMGGRLILPFGKREEDYKTFNEKDLDNVVKNLQSYYDMSAANGYKEIDLSTRQKKLDYIQSLIDKMKKREMKEFKSFKNRHVDKPIVDYIRVYELRDFTVYPQKHTNDPKTDTPMDFRRMGIGAALYIEMTKYLHKKGLKLYASTLQSKEAESAWVNLKKLGLTNTDRERMYLDYNKIKNL